MTKKLLHFLWLYQYFKKQNLKLENGDAIKIFNPGRYNNHATPDFLEAKLNIEGTLWIGNVELHLTTAEYFEKVGSSNDNVILHVVWENEKLSHCIVCTDSCSKLSECPKAVIREPILIIKPRIPTDIQFQLTDLIKKYKIEDDGNFIKVLKNRTHTLPNDRRKDFYKKMGRR